MRLIDCIFKPRERIAIGVLKEEGRDDVSLTSMSKSNHTSFIIDQKQIPDFIQSLEAEFRDNPRETYRIDINQKNENLQAIPVMGSNPNCYTEIPHKYLKYVVKALKEASEIEVDERYYRDFGDALLI